MTTRTTLTLMLVVLLGPLVPARAASDPNDTAGTKDPPLFSR